MQTSSKIMCNKKKLLTLYAKTAETRITAEFPLFLKSEASGIRTPDNLIKSQVLDALNPA